ncbi:MAG: hypothetical protein ACR2MN_04475 [Acidimicrobiales bacterium]
MGRRRARCSARRDRHVEPGAAVEPLVAVECPAAVEPLADVEALGAGGLLAAAGAGFLAHSLAAWIVGRPLGGAILRAPVRDDGPRPFEACGAAVRFA